MKITVESGPRQGTQTELAGSYVIGREPDCNLVLDADTNVSRRHAAFEPTGDGGFVLRDLGSANGTFVDGVRVGQPVRLLGGERVLIGTTTIAVARLALATGPVPPTEPIVAAPVPIAGTMVNPPVPAGPAGTAVWQGAPAGVAPPAQPPYPGGPSESYHPGPPPDWRVIPTGGRPGNRNLMYAGAGAAVLVLVLVVGLFLVLGGGNDDQSAAASSSSSQTTKGGKDSGGGDRSAGVERYCELLGGLAADLDAVPPPQSDAEAKAAYQDFLSSHRAQLVELVSLAKGEQRGQLQTILSSVNKASKGDSAALDSPEFQDAVNGVGDYVDKEC